MTHARPRALDPADPDPIELDLPEPDGSSDPTR